MDVGGTKEGVMGISKASAMGARGRWLAMVGGGAVKAGG